MSSAVFALLVNVAVAGLFATTFLAVAMSKGAPNSAKWFAVAYFIGMLTPLSELAIRFTSFQSFFIFSSFVTFLSAFLVTAIALARHFNQPASWAVFFGVLAASLLIRVGIWDGPRNTMPYELIYQLPLAASTFLCGLIVHRSNPTFRSERSIRLIFLIVSAHFIVKAFAAVWVGTGETAHAYVNSAYALISQSVTAILLVAVGLILLFDVFRRMLTTANIASDVDVLSGLFNRRGFEVAAANVIQRTRSKPLLHVSLCLFDLDKFKEINDTYGHLIGDEIIRRFAEVLRENSPSKSICARIGGEEFVVLIENCNATMARMFAENIRTQFDTKRFAEIVARTSVGVTSSQGQTSLKELLGQADTALYDAKKSGRNCVHIFMQDKLGSDYSIKAAQS